MIIAPFEPHHAPAIARLHRSCIPAGFLSTLPTGFLTRLYTAIASAPGSIVLVALPHPDASAPYSPAPGPGGFAAFAADTPSMYRAVLRRQWLHFALALAPRALSVASVKRIVETLRYGKQRPADDSALPRAELLSIAIEPDMRGKGSGRALVAALEHRIRELADPPGGYTVVTSALDPRSNAFYRAVGFQPVRQFTHHGHPMQQYAKQL